ncbi:MAG: response regulator [Alphaproteobacteria bacterium]
MHKKHKNEDLKILVASDSKHFISMVRVALTAEGIENITDAEDSKKALNELALHLPDIMIISWNFRPLSGVDFCRSIRSNPQNPARYLPIIMANEFSCKEQVKTAVDAGINELVVIPFSTKNILTKIHHVLEKPRTFIETPDYFGPDRRRRDDPSYKGIERRKKAGVMTPEQIAELLKANKS